ncbi:MAG: phenylalanine--tRNA ligase beta subunit-related protein [Thomasclavelia ramosa]
MKLIYQKFHLSTEEVESALKLKLIYVHFCAKLVKGVTTKESPEWPRNALIASGIKPINNIVDISIL